MYKERTLKCHSKNAEDESPETRPDSDLQEIHMNGLAELKISGLVQTKGNLGVTPTKIT